MEPLQADSIAENFQHQEAMMKRLNPTWLLLFLLARTGFILAEGETRPITSAEKEFFSKVMSTFAKALPPGPEGWTQHHTSSVIPPERVALGAEKHPLFLSYYINWKDTKRVDAYDAKSKQMLMQQANQKPDPKAQAELMAEYNRISKELESALRKSDKAEIQRLQKEMSVVGEKMKNLSAPLVQTVQNVTSDSPHDIEVNVKLTTNKFSESLGKGAIAEAPIDGVLIYRVNSVRRGGTGWKDGETYAFVGNWKNVSQSGGTEMASPTNPKLPYTAVQAIVVTVGAEKARGRAFLEKINWTALKSLIQR
jgi:hypothetical protein